ncbi:hypothetical protein DAPPUDRAFT_312106 [Daphnia pulex]|uniref:Uncharacterized protein n=1 Tax=Daphnia pulex TaxID=6669 RepID=E9FYV7_DAPPU|nr:hypothetical protein DAPPUDRAFT_312106 [Daphnia pulex]|eukprot:EFX87709.1 hypothetical protein DAPPUDRAFT_312106 [Daphnia pulex]
MQLSQLITVKFELEQEAAVAKETLENQNQDGGRELQRGSGYLWKMLSEDDVEMKCRMFPSSAVKCSEPVIEVLTNPVNRSIHLIGLLLPGGIDQKLKGTSGGQICLQLLGVG